MSWNSMSGVEAGAKLFKYDEDGGLGVDWTCPRCGKRNIKDLDLGQLAEDGVEVSCQNTTVCGIHRSYFRVNIELEDGAYVGVADVPLNNQPKTD